MDERKRQYVQLGEGVLNMIHFFDKRRLFFPVSWANSVSRWILGLHSPSGTVRITNTASPGEGASAAIDVDVDAVANRVMKIIGGDARGFSPRECALVRDLVGAYVDGATVLWKDRRIAVNTDWLEGWISNKIASSLDLPAPSAPNNPNNVQSGFAVNGSAGNMSDTHMFGTRGATIQLACRGTSNGESGVVKFRPFTIAADGRLYAIGAESSGFGFFTA